MGKNESKIKHDTLCNDYEIGIKKCRYILKRLYDENFHLWKAK